MKHWRVEKQNRLLTEVKSRFSKEYSVKNLRWLIEHNRCFVNANVERFASSIVKKGDLISLELEQEPAFCKETNRILFEDDALLVYDKPPLLCSEELARLTYTRLVHRLDRDTSGVILLAKHPEVQKDLEAQFRNRTVKKEYLALVEGITKKNGVISGKMAPIKRREGAVIWGMHTQGLWSQTKWSCLATQDNISLLHCIPYTGRTHQIRVHLSFIGHPIVGDFTYGSLKRREAIFRPLLHAYRLSFYHPISKENLILTAPLTSEFLKFSLFNRLQRLC